MPATVVAFGRSGFTQDAVRELDAATRNRRLRQASAALADLQQRLSRRRTRFHERVPVEQAVAQILEGLEITAWLTERIPQSVTGDILPGDAPPTECAEADFRTAVLRVAQISRNNAWKRLNPYLNEFRRLENFVVAGK